MSEIPSPGWYRLFQKIALAIGLVAALLGFVMQNSAVWGAGLVILVHALIATVILAVEDRRSGEPSARDNPVSRGT